MTWIELLDKLRGAPGVTITWHHDVFVGQLAHDHLDRGGLCRFEVFFGQFYSSFTVEPDADVYSGNGGINVLSYTHKPRPGADRARLPSGLSSFAMAWLRAAIQEAERR